MPSSGLPANLRPWPAIYGRKIWIVPSGSRPIRAGTSNGCSKISPWGWEDPQGESKIEPRTMLTGTLRQGLELFVGKPLDIQVIASGLLSVIGPLQRAAAKGLGPCGPGCALPLDNSAEPCIILDLGVCCQKSFQFGMPP